MKQSWSIAGSLLAAACGVSPDGAIEAGQFGIVGGLLAPSEELDHTGAIVRVDRETGARHVVCTATIIGPETALTAKHCANRIALIATLEQDVSLAVGGDIATAELVPIASTQLPDAGGEPGALGLGYDLAVVHLDAPVAVRPALARPFSSAWARGAVVTLGYGMPGAWSQPDGFRRIGRETVVAVEGRVYEILYGNFETYLEVEQTGVLTNEDYLAKVQADPSLADLDALRDTYEQTRLVPGHEIITKTLDGNTRSCRGDSGGPLLRVSARGQWEVYGVLSGGPSSARAECDFGQVYSVLGPKTFPFVEASLRWADPCGNLQAEGTCTGSVAERCETNLSANLRRPVHEDCSAAGLTCQITKRTAQCVAPTNP